MSGIPAGPFGLTLITTAAALLVMMAVTFAVALKAGRHSVVDTAWGLGIALAAVVSLLASSGHGQPARRYLLLAASVIWGLRLAGYVTWRNHGKGEDPRYRDLLSRAPGNPNAYALRTVYLLQAAILWLAWLPIQAGMLERAPVGALTVIGAVLWLGGFVFESAGDWQLARFKADPGNQGLIMDRGLWRYTRHPQLLRRRVHVVGPVPDQPGLLGGAPVRGRAAADDRHLDPGHRPTAHRPADGRHPPQVRRLRRPHQRLHPPPAPRAVDAATDRRGTAAARF